VAGGAVELSHQEVGIEEEDDEGDLDERAQDVAEGVRRLWGKGHGTILLRLNSIEDNEVVSHPFRKERGMDGAPAAEWMGHPLRRSWTIL